MTSHAEVSNGSIDFTSARFPKALDDFAATKRLFQRERERGLTVITVITQKRERTFSFPSLFRLYFHFIRTSLCLQISALEPLDPLGDP
jgi:hypothetical protein